MAVVKAPWHKPSALITELKCIAESGHDGAGEAGGGQIVQRLGSHSKSLLSTIEQWRH